MVPSFKLGVGQVMALHASSCLLDMAIGWEVSRKVIKEVLDIYAGKGEKGPSSICQMLGQRQSSGNF